MSKAAGLATHRPTHNIDMRPMPARKNAYRYDTEWPIYAMDWSNAPDDKQGFRLAVGSVNEEGMSSSTALNKLQVITHSDLVETDYETKSRSDFVVLGDVDISYPLTKIMWDPRKIMHDTEFLVTSSDMLRIWAVEASPDYISYNNSSNTIGARHKDRHPLQLDCRMNLLNPQKTEFCAPITSFDWINETVVAASIDTTCTVWDIRTGQAKTQLIAHDGDVYDVAFRPREPDTFASVGADGSVRLFDLRQLEHSTILYEAPYAENFGAAISNGSQPLLRLQFNPFDDMLLATFYMDSDKVQILDIRYPGGPVAVLEGSHRSNVNCFQWSPIRDGHICTGGDDAQMFVWDVYGNSKPRGYSHRQARKEREFDFAPKPILQHIPEADAEVNAVCWNRSAHFNNWVAVGCGKSVEVISVGTGQD